MMGTGRIHMYYGDGKGKTTAAVGQAVRAAGYGLQVLFFQFLKLRHYNNKALDEIVKFCTNFDVLVLDEALCAIHLNVLSEEKIRSFLEHKPRGLEVILTGHEVSQDMLDLADYATMMMKVKHPYDRKVMAREGIEF